MNSQTDQHNVFTDHDRNWGDNHYVYPVISRRSKGLSIGINLNPDKACNFDCIYCQVDRSVAPEVRRVDLAQLETELAHMLHLATTGELFDDLRFGSVPAELRRINDIAFSGDGEPTTCPQFAQAVDLTIRLKQQHRLSNVKIVIITDACYLAKPQVSQALRKIEDHQGEVWAKLDAGTEDYYELINRPNFPLAHVVDNITAEAARRPVVIQALFMCVYDQGPTDEEIHAFCERLNDITGRGGSILLVQIYTVARRPAQPYVSALPNQRVDQIADSVRLLTGLTVEAFYGT